METITHIVGAGLAGLAAGVRLARAGRRVVLYEASGHAGGRCRSFHDDVLGATIDNGNHLLLSGNRSALAYLDDIGAADSLTGPDDAAFPFVDLTTGQRWTVRLNAGPIPWWVLMADRRPPGSRAMDFLAVLRLARAGPDATVGGLFGGHGAMFTHFLEPLAVAALNTPADAAAARPLWAVFRETFARGATACRPLIARDGLSRSFIDPALERLQALGAEIRFGHRLRRVAVSGPAIAGLDFGDGEIAVQPADRVVFALPPAALKAVLPDMAVPEDSHAIVNAHFRLPEPLPEAKNIPFLGVIGGVAQWLFVRGAMVSVTVSAADALADLPAPVIGARIWDDVARALALPGGPPPPFRIVKERRATFAQTPAAMRRRPGVRGPLANLFLAGDWTDTGLPATIESAIRSGHLAASAIAEN